MLIPNDGRIIDIGCGAGVFLQILAMYRSPSSLAGIETNASVISVANSTLNHRATANPVRLEVYDGINFPRWIENYQYAVLIDVLHHISKTQQLAFLKSLFASLRSGSILIIKDINGDHLFWLLFNRLHDLVMARQLVHEIRPSILESGLREIGFKIKAITKRRMMVYSHYTIVCEKP
jgi:2-polyprenyl-3-methyl-5-hydroxy-6-metoxy-1,4-benzoquinol methylase